MVGRVLTNQTDYSNRCKHKENKTRNLQPELMQHTAKMRQRSPGAAYQCAKGPTALYLLASYPCRHTQFLGRRSICHCSRFYQCPGLEYGFRGEFVVARFGI